LTGDFDAMTHVLNGEKAKISIIEVFTFKNLIYNEVGYVAIYWS